MNASRNEPTAPVERPRRGRPPELSTKQVVDTARRLLGPTGDPTTLNLRLLAAELDVTAMALYRYVADKDALLELVVDELLTETGMPRTPRSGSWETFLRETSTRLFDLITTSPTAAYIYATRPVSTAAALRRMETILHVLCNAHLTDAEALNIYTEIHIYTIGFATIAASRTRHQPNTPGTAPDPWSQFFHSLPAETYPILVRLAPDLAEFTSNAHFERGLRRLIKQLAAETSRQ